MSPVIAMAVRLEAIHRSWTFAAAAPELAMSRTNARHSTLVRAPVISPPLWSDRSDAANVRNGSKADIRFALDSNANSSKLGR